MEAQNKQLMNRFYLVVLGLFLFGFVLIGKLFFIQTQEGEYYRKLAKQRTVKNVILEPSRGNIYADDKSILATSVPQYEIRWDAKVPSKSIFDKHKSELAQGLAELLGKSDNYYLRLLEQSRRTNNRYTLIARNLSYSKYKKIKSLPLFKLPSLRGGLIVESKLVQGTSHRENR